jgi:hypothetical protein
MAITVRHSIQMAEDNRGLGRAGLVQAEGLMRVRKTMIGVVLAALTMLALAPVAEASYRAQATRGGFLTEQSSGFDLGAWLAQLFGGGDEGVGMDPLG